MIKFFCSSAVLFLGLTPILGQQPNASPTPDTNNPVVKAKTANAEDKKGDNKEVRGDLLNGKALSLPKPTYPKEALAARAREVVNVQVVVGEDGKVYSAVAYSGDPLLHAAAEEAAKRAVFSPTMAEGAPVKRVGTLSYNFIATPLIESALILGRNFSILRSDRPDLLLRKDISMADMLKMFAAGVPDELIAQKALFDELATAKESERPAVAGKVFDTIRPLMSEEERWKFDTGYYLANAIIEIRRQIEGKQPEKVSFDTIRIKSKLQIISDHMVSIPSGIPSDLGEKLTMVTAFENAPELATWDSVQRLLSILYAASK